ncbi:MAG: amidase [Hylemonella sp.]|nr:amidase [Hylemonella sp.]
MTDSKKYFHELGATDLVSRLGQGTIALQEYVDAMLAYSAAADEQVKAFAHHSPDIVNLQVERVNDARQDPGSRLSLLGVPVAVKDNIDTEDYPTEYGYAGAEGRTPRVDAYLVHKLRAAGAIVWAKSRTTELAYMQPTVTTNPRVPGHTPGGSSSGSAAAVAAGMVPVAIGTQTNGSVIRPASFCGVFGYKPSRGLIFNGGVLKCSESLDQVGVFARHVEDLAAVAEVMIGGHETGEGRLVFPQDLRRVCESEPPLTPKFMFARTPLWDKVEPVSQSAFLELLDELKDCMSEVELPTSVGNALPLLKTVMEAEMHVNLKPVVDEAGGKASKPTLDLLARGADISAADYLRAKGRMDLATQGFDEYFDHFDAIVVPATLGPAPKGLDTTGDPAMCTIWTYAGLPCLSLPLLQTEDGQPIGVQLIGRMNDDARLLRTARWLVQRLAAQ